MACDADAGPARVLVVEDDEPLREAMVRALTRAGYQVVAAACGADAVESGRATRPDAAVIDVFLGDSGGLGVARDLRRDLPGVPVLFVTGAQYALDFFEVTAVKVESLRSTWSSFWHAGQAGSWVSCSATWSTAVKGFSQRLHQYS